jgi:UDP-N-acetylmuramate dehydrogenase
LGQKIILVILFKLSKKFKPDISYRDLERALSTDCTANELFNEVIKIRTNKLPNVKKFGNAGSFFKNPIVNYKKIDELKNSINDIKFFEIGNQMYKIPAAFLIEKANWKGYRKGDTGVSPKHALILVNYGKASGREIYELSENIIESVNNIFGIELEREVNVI